MTNLYFHWRRLIVINIGIFVCYTIYKLSRDFLSLPYIHFLVDYHFGFTRRALVGAVTSFFLDKIPPWLPWATGLTAIAITIALYVKLFQKTFGFSKATAPLFVFLAGSPFFFKNFLVQVGYFDVIGCAFAIVMLLLPSQSFWFVVAGAAFSSLLIFIHSGQTLLFVPTILLIVAVRYFLSKPLNYAQIAGGFGLLLLVAASAFVNVAYGNLDVPREEFTRYLQSRSLSTNDNWMVYIFVWFDTLTEGLHITRAGLPKQLLALPIYLLLFALHAPLIRYYRESLALLSLRDRRLILAGMAGITAAYVLVFVLVSDYARWVADWAVCMMLVLHLVKQLPSTRPAPLIACDNMRNIRFGLFVTIIPRTGGVTPW